MTRSYEAFASSCDETLILGWSRSRSRRQRTTETTYVACTPMLRMADFNITFDRAGHIRSARSVTAFTSTWPYTDYANNTTARQPVINAIHYRMRDDFSPWHAGRLSSDWLNHLVALRTGSRAALDPAAPLPNTTVLLPAVEAVYSMVFAAFLTLNPLLFADADGVPKVVRTRSRTETRIFVSTPALVVSVALMALYVVVLVAYYGRGVRRLFLPRMPSTVGSVLAYVVPSSIATARDERVALRFGRYVGSDGRAQMGIDAADKIVPLDMKRLGYGDTKPSRFRFSDLGDHEQNKLGFNLSVTHAKLAVLKGVKRLYSK